MRASETEVEQFRVILQESLSFPRTRDPDWMERYDRADLRLVKRGGRVAAGLVLLPCGQFLGGRRVDMVGVHAVAVAPEHRGTGVGRELMTEMVREQASKGVPIAVLYPATQPVYRAVGFEQAGTFTRHRVPLAAVPVGPRDLAVERVASDVKSASAALGELHRRACAHHGSVDRTPWLWRRVVDPIGVPSTVFCVREDGRVTGYVVVAREWDHGRIAEFELRCRALVAETPRALARLWTFLAGERSFGRDVVVIGPPVPGHPLWFPEHRGTVDLQLQWMTRILDVEKALAARGYARGVAGSAAFEVTDELLDSNRGRFTVEVSGGRATVTRGGAGAAVALGVGALASLYGGFLTAEELARHGLAEGTAEALAAATAIFRGDPPWMAEMF